MWHLVVDVVTAHSNGVHDVFPSLVFLGGTVWDVVWVMFCSKIVTQFVRCHQVGFLGREYTELKRHIL